MRLKLLPAISIIGIFVLAIQCSKNEVVELPEKIVSVELAPVQSEAISLPIHGSGMLFSKQQIRLSFKTGGLVEKLYVKEGQNVNKGQKLAQLQLDEIEAQVQQARSGYEKAQRDSERVQKLYADSVVTQEQMQNVETQLRVAESTLKIAEFNLEYSTIKAPVDGRILKRFVEPNELVGPGNPVFYFGSGREEWLVRVGVADRDIVKLQLGDPAIVTFDAYPEMEFPATVTGLAQAADPQNGTFEVEILLDAKGQRLAAGFVAQVVFQPNRTDHYTLVPVVSLVEAQGRSGSVFTVVDDTVQTIPVTIGPILNERVVVSGLDGIQAVVTTGAPYLKAGDRVQIK